MSTKYLRSKEDGFIYDWTELLSQNPLVEEVTEEEAYPERFPEEAPKVRKARGAAATEEPKPVSATPPELAAEASKGFPN